MSFPEGYFESELTTAKFDRTPEQRQDRSRIVASRHHEWPELSSAEVQASANEAMMMRLGISIEVMEDARLLEFANEKSKLGELVVDVETVTTRINEEIVRELDELDEALPHPSLDRLVSN